jgi:hypothetical protein
VPRVVPLLRNPEVETGMKKMNEQSRPGALRNVLVVAVLFAIVIAIYVASFLVRH